MTITREQLTDVYDEVERRLKLDISYCMELALELTENEVKDWRNSMLQGVYSTLMVLTGTQWPDVVQMIDAEENERYWREQDG